MTATLTSTTAFMHPHHGVAIADGEPRVRVVAGRECAMQPLVSAPVPSWASLLGLSGGALTSSEVIRSLVPVDALESGNSLWTPCPAMDPSFVAAQVRELPVDLWVDRIDVPQPAKMVDQCSKFLAGVGISESPNDEAAQLAVQIGDYLSLWHLAAISDVERSSARREAAAKFETSIASDGPFWSKSVGQTYAMRANGRDLVVLLTRLTAVIAAGSSDSAADVALLLDVALSDRLRARRSALESLIPSSRGGDKNAA